MKSTCFSYKLFTSGWWLATLIRSAIHFTLCEQTGVGWLYDYSRVQYHKMILLAVNKHLNDLHLWHGTRSERKSVRYKLRRGVQDYTDVACVYSVVHRRRFSQVFIRLKLICISYKTYRGIAAFRTTALTPTSIHSLSSLSSTGSKTNFRSALMTWHDIWKRVTRLP